MHERIAFDWNIVTKYGRCGYISTKKEWKAVMNAIGYDRFDRLKNFLIDAKLVLKIPFKAMKINQLIIENAEYR